MPTQRVRNLVEIVGTSAYIKISQAVTIGFRIYVVFNSDTADSNTGTWVVIIPSIYEVKFNLKFSE